MEFPSNTGENLELFPYRVIHMYVQELHEADFAARADYCQWFWSTFDDRLLEKTFFTNEACFPLCGYIHSQNMRI